MRVLNWALDAQKTMYGKIISVVLSVALIFSFSNFFYGDNAFAEEQKVETNTEVTTEPAQSEPVVTETEKKSEEPQSKAPEQELTETSQTEKATASEDQLSTQAEGDTDVNAGNKEESTESGEKVVNTSADLNATWDASTKTLTINNIDTLNQDVALAYAKELGTKASDVQNLKINNVTSVSANAFHSSLWTSLKKVEITKVDTIFDHAFSKLPALNEVILSDVAKLEDSDAYGHSNAFSECGALTSVTLSDIGYLGEEAFRRDLVLAEINLHNIKEIGTSPFSGCIGLTSVTLDGNDGIGDLGVTMFYGCTGLKNATIKNLNIGTQAFNGCTSLETVTLENVGDIAQQTFYGCSSLKDVSLKGDIKSIGSSVFQKCGNAINLSISDTNIIPEKAFLSATAIKTLTLNNVTSIGTNAFASCKGIETVSLSGVDTIGQYAFYNCTSLQTVNMAEIDKIVNYAFWKCGKLSSINSLSNVKTSIGGFAFLECASLTGLTVADLTKMGYIGNSEEIMARVQAILAGKFNLDDAENINELGLEEGWAAGEVGKSSNWNAYDNGTQIMEQARWADENAGVAEVKVDAYYTGEKQMDYIFVADLSASMAQLVNPEDNNARFYDMQSKLMDMTGKLLDTPGYDCRVAIVSFGGEYNNNATQNSSGFISESGAAASYIEGLSPLNENTDYGLGLQKALELVQANANRNTVVVFLSDGAPTAGTSGDQYGTTAAAAINELNVPIYGVLHSPTAKGTEDAEKRMNDVCDYVYRSTDTESFGNAMNSAFAAAYGNNTVTIPVNARDFNINNLNASAGTVEYNDGVITWTLSGMPFTQHTLTYNMNLTEENANRIGTYEYGLNNGNAHFGDTGASAGLSLSLSRTVADPANPDPTPTPTPDPTPAPEPDPAPNPGDGGATTPDDGGATIPDGGGATTPAAAPAAPAATPAAPAAAPAAPAVVIPDEENPLAAPEQEIADDENPLAAFDHEECWVHWLMIAGIILTIIYGAVVVLRRTRNTKHIDKMEKDLIGATDESTVTVGSTHHSHA